MSCRKDRLPNGIRVVTEAMPHVRSVAVGIWVETGSRVEPESRGGISHLIEHLVFKGTGTRSAEQIASAIDSVGGQMDAFTAKEHTCFYVSVLDDHLALAVDLLADILMHPLFAAPDIEKEKAVVFQEIKMVEDTADDLIHDLFAERVWAGHPLGRPILGRWDVVRGLDRETILAHFEEEYAPGRIVIAAAGHLEHAQVVDLFAARFNGFRRPAAERPSAPPTLCAGVHMIHKPLEQVHLVAGFPGIPETAPERYALYLLNDVIGGSMSSRLFQEIRERQALAYSVHSGLQSYRDTGLFYVHEQNSLRISYLMEPDPRGSMGLGGTTGGANLSWGTNIVAVDYKTGKITWRKELNGGSAGLLTTAGGVLFLSNGGNVEAWDAATGKGLWYSQIGGLGAPAETFMLDGKQHLLFSAGGGLYMFVLN